MRAIMTREELAKHHVDKGGRDYRLSCDGYGDMEVAANEGWHAVSGWGLDGWDLGDWPYVVISVRNLDGDVYEMRQTVEGDTDVYRFTTIEDRCAAIDYLFVWYGLGREYDEWGDAGLTYDKREALDAGALRVPERFRGAFSWDRLNENEAATIAQEVTRTGLAVHMVAPNATEAVKARAVEILNGAGPLKV